jgi:hypothetical protein
MTSGDSGDVSGVSWERLMPLAPDPDRAERVRARCRTQLGRGRRRAARTAVITAFAWHVLAPLLVGGFCVLYVALLAAATLRFRDIFH